MLRGPELVRVLWAALFASLLATSLASAQTVLYRVNAGGPQLAAADGSSPPWSGDPQGAPSPYVNAGATGDLTFSTSNPITINLEVPASVPMALFQTERWDAAAAPEMRWSFPVSDGTYEVRLFFAEIYPGAQSVGFRVFDVAIEGATVLDHYDQYDAVGGYTGTMKSFAVSTSDGSLDIDFLHGTENPAIKGIEILTATFGDIGAGLPGVSDGAAVWGDYDNDGDLDLALTGQTGSGLISRVYENTGGSFADINAGLPGVSYSSVAWGDYDNDDDLDLALTGQTGSGLISRVYKNTGGSFADINAGLPGVSDGAAAWGDYDNDGDLDLALTGWDGSGRISRVYENAGGSFVDINAGLPGVSYSSVAWGDYDNDGDLDLVLTGDDGSVGISRVYQNTGGSFADINAGLPVSGIAVAWGDYDNDGYLDLVLGRHYTRGNSRVYRNMGGSFADINAGLPGVGTGAAAWGDYDNDGDLDLVLSGFLCHVYQNTSGSFADINAVLPGVDAGAVAWGDYDNDGDLDLVITGGNRSAGISHVYRNTPPIANTPPTAPTGLSVTFDATAATFQWEAPGEIGLSYNLRIGTTPGGGEIMSPMADMTTGYRRVAQLGNVNENVQWSVSLERMVGCPFYWSVQAVDQAFAGSPFAPEQGIPPAAAGWPACGVGLSGGGDDLAPAGVADGCGGAIVAWVHVTLVAAPTLSIGRVSAGGSLWWGAGGIPLGGSISDPPRITSDGAGGAIVAWADFNHSHIYAERVSAWGVPQWGPLLICTEPGASSPVPVADGAGGAIIAWHDFRSGNADVYAQRVGASGAIALGWPADGVPLSQAAGNQSYVELASDGDEGAIVTWFDTRNGNNDVYAQRVRYDGLPLWTVNGVEICTAPGDQDYTPIISDGAGGAIIAWHDGRAANRHIYAQRVDGGGTPRWTGDGVELTPLVAGQQGFPTLAPDDAGGAIVAWQDEGNAGNADIYACRVSAAGKLQGPRDGVALCTANDQQTAPKLVADGAGGALATWQDQREGTHTEIYAQHVSSAGALADGWPADGLVLCAAHYPQQAPVIVGDAAGGAIVAWEDRRSGGADIYAARVRGTGSVVTAVPSVYAPTPRGPLAWPNPFRGEVRLGFEFPAAMAVGLEVFDLGGRRVRSVAPVAYGPGSHAITWDGRGDDGARQAEGIYFMRVRGPEFTVTRRVVRLK